MAESAVVTQSAAVGMAGVRNHHGGHAQGSGEGQVFGARPAHHQRRGFLVHRMDIEQQVDAFDQRPQRSGAAQFNGVAPAIEHREHSAH